MVTNASSLVSAAPAKAIAAMDVFSATITAAPIDTYTTSIAVVRGEAENGRPGGALLRHARLAEPERPRHSPAG